MRFGCVLLAVLATTCAAADIPVVGRPADLPFSGASAGFVRSADGVVCPFEAETDVAPRRVEAEQPVTMIVTIRARGKVHQTPTAIDARELGELPAFRRSFYVEDIGEGKIDQPDASTWRWRYRLKPKHLNVSQIPRVPFVFHNPDLRPAEKSFQIIWTDAVPITVTRPILEQIHKPLSPGITALVSGPAVVADRTPWGGPDMSTLIVAVLGPPLLCCAWYLVWWRMYPNEARRAVRRRSSAARRALAALNTASRKTGRPRAEATTQAVLGYLRERYDLPVREPTPDEAAEWLERAGVTQQDAVRELLRACAAARFAPEAENANIIELSRAFITLIEEEPCPRSS